MLGKRYINVLDLQDRAMFAGGRSSMQVISMSRGYPPRFADTMRYARCEVTCAIGWIWIERKLLTHCGVSDIVLLDSHIATLIIMMPTQGSI